MEIIAHCNNSCCPSIVINEKDRSQPVLITDDYQGSIPLTLREFEQVSKYIANIQKANDFPMVVSDHEFFIHGYETDKPYVSIQMIDATRKVRDISFDHWGIFTEAIAKYYGVPT